jgi:serine protease Do
MAELIASRSRFAIAIAAAAMMGLTSLPAAAVGPQSVADLVDPLLPAVVTISTSQTVAAQRSVAPAPTLPDGSPFQDFFNDFFDKQNTPNNSQPRRVQSLGSGFVIDPAGFIVTNNHVIEDADEITANFTDGSHLKATVVGIDDKTDLAVLKVDADHPLPAVAFGDSRALRVGDWVMAVGNPFGFGGSVTLGIVSARNRDINSGPYDDFIQTDAAINKGNSGGPLFAMDGSVVGINTAIVSPTGGSIGIGFAVPSEIARGIIDQLRSFGETRRGWLGVRIQPVTAEVAQGLGMASAHGALIAGVDSPGPAADAGIMAGDVIVSFGGQKVDTMNALPRMVADQAVGQEVDVVVLREGSERTLKVTLGQLAEKQVAALEPAPAPAEPPPPPPPLGVTGPLGLTIADLSPALRDKFSLNPSITKGVVVVAVSGGSAAAEKRLQPGDVIVEIAQEPVATVDDISKRIDTLKKEGRTTAQFVVQNKDGNVRWVNVTIE